MSNYDNNLQVIVKKVNPDKYKKNPPSLTVEAEIGGRKYSTGLWRWTRKDGSAVLDENGNPMLKGTLKEWDSENPGKERQQGAASGGQAPPGPADRAFQEAHSKMKDEFDDDIPF